MRSAVIIAAIFLAAVPSIAQARSACHSANGTYTNVDGNQIPDPACIPKGKHVSGETAICRDGSHSFSQHRTGTCSRHGGVAQWE